jgi:uncharacterized membrane protein
MAEVINHNIDEDINKKSSTGIDTKLCSLLSYLFSWIGGLIFWLAEKKNKFVKWNALQAIFLGILDIIAVILFSTIYFIGPLLWIVEVLYLVVWVFRIIAIVRPYKGSTFRIPGISKLVDRAFRI